MTVGANAQLPALHKSKAAVHLLSPAWLSVWNDLKDKAKKEIVRGSF